MYQAFELFLSQVESLLSTETFFLISVYIISSGFVLFVLLYVFPRIILYRQFRRKVLDDSNISPRSLLARRERQAAETEIPIERYFEKIQQGDPEAIEARLLRAGYYGKNAVSIFYLIRIFFFLAVFIAFLMLARYMLPNVSFSILFAATLVYSTLFLFVPNIVVDRMAAKLEKSYRLGFPDFMDLMIVCADAGMSLEAAVERVASELIYTHKSLGIQLKIMTLEIRAGRRLRDALHNFADRLNTDEAKSLAVLFRQSEELGTSLTQTLRIYSEEMREKRMIAAEEKANALPVKMVFPLGFCVFPVILVMVMLPMLVRFKGVFF